MDKLIEGIKERMVEEISANEAEAKRALKLGNMLDHSYYSGAKNALRFMYDVVCEKEKYCPKEERHST